MNLHLTLLHIAIRISTQINIIKIRNEGLLCLILLKTEKKLKKT